MDIMVIGSGGREHAIIRKLRENSSVGKIWALPGNGGIGRDAECVPIDETDIDGIVSFAKQNGPDYAVVAPDAALFRGCVDALTNIGIPCFGPDSKAAVIEGSKVFAKKMMRKYGIPTARFHIFENTDDALYYIESAPLPAVIKADGPAGGKGVIIAETREAAKTAVTEIMQEHRFGASGDRIVVEEFLEGPEVSILCFTDGKTIVPMISSMDHKRAFDGDKGLNTGGMGTVAPNPYYTKPVAERCMKEIFLPTVSAMREEGRPFKGCLYFGLMVTADGPKVIEYNCRFGDPEAQVVLPLLDSDLLTVMRAVTEERLDETEVKWSEQSACCVVAASEGYPVSYEKGYEIYIPDDVWSHVYVAGAEEEDGELLTSGGRVLGVTAVRQTLAEAVEASYDILDEIEFANKYYRADIGQRALKALR